MSISNYNFTFLKKNMHIMLNFPMHCTSYRQTKTVRGRITKNITHTHPPTIVDKYFKMSL